MAADEQSGRPCRSTGVDIVQVVSHHDALFWRGPEVPQKHLNPFGVRLWSCRIPSENRRLVEHRPQANGIERTQCHGPSVSSEDPQSAARPTKMGQELFGVWLQLRLGRQLQLPLPKPILRRRTSGWGTTRECSQDVLLWPNLQHSACMLKVVHWNCQRAIEVEEPDGTAGPIEKG